MKQSLFPNRLVMGLAAIIGTFALSSSVDARPSSFDPAKDCAFFDKIVFDICKADHYGKEKCDGPYDYKVEDEFGTVSPNLKDVAREAACDGYDKCDVRIISVEFAADCNDKKLSKD